MAGEKFTVTLAANIRDFIENMKKAGKALGTVKMQNRGIVKGIQEMNSSFNQSGKRFFQTTQKFKSGVDGIGRSTSGLNNKLAKTAANFSLLAKGGIAAAAAVGTLGTAFLALRSALRTAEIGAAFKVQARAFANLVANQGVQAEQLVRQLQNASKGTLDTLALITTASRALLLRIPANRLVELMDVARKASKAMGTTVAGAFSDISLGIGRQSRLILDNLGIIVRVQVAYDNYARKIGTTANALTDFEKSQAFLNEALEQGKEKFEKSAPNVIDFRDRMDQMRTIAIDASKRIAVALLVPFEALFDTLSELGIGTKIKKFFEVDFPKDLQKMLLLYISFFETIRTVKNDLVTVAKFMETFFVQIAEFTGFLDASKLVNKGLGLIFSGFKKATKGVTEAHKDMKEEVDDPGFLSTFIKNMKDGTSKTNSFLDAIFGQGGDRPSLATVAERQVKSLNIALEDTVSKASDISAEFAKGLPLIEKGIQSLTEKIQALTPTLSLTPSGNALIEGLKQQRAALQGELNKLKTAQKEVVTPAQFLESKGLQIDARRIQAAKTAAEEMERLIKNFPNLSKTSSEEIGQIGLKIFTDAKVNINSLDKDLQERLLKSKKTFERLIPDKKKIKEMKKEMQEIVPVDSFKKGLNQWVDDYNNAGNRLSEIGKSIAEGMSKGFDDFFFNTITGKVNSLTDAFKGMFQSILRATTKFLGDKATQEFLGLAFGATGQTTKSQIGPTGGPGGLLGMVGKLFGKGAKAPTLGQPGTPSFGAGFPGTPSFVGPPSKPTPSILGSGGFGGIFSALKSIGSIFGFADGGIASFAGAGTGIHATPKLAAIAEKPGKKEAVMPLEKFTDLVQPVNINISTVDTKSFQQYMMDNKEVVLGTIMGIKGSRTVDGFQRQQRGPF